MKRHQLIPVDNALAVPPEVGLRLGISTSLPTASRKYLGDMRVFDGQTYVCAESTTPGTYVWIGFAPWRPEVTLGPWFAENLVGTASDRITALPYMPTSTSIGQAGVNPGNELYMPRAGRVVGAYLNSNAARTAGTATLRVGIDGSFSAFASGNCVLNGTHTTIISAWDDAGPSFTAGQRIRPTITTSSWTPTTADISAWLVVRYD